MQLPFSSDVRKKTKKTFKIMNEDEINKRGGNILNNVKKMIKSSLTMNNNNNNNNNNSKKIKYIKASESLKYMKKHK